MDRNSILSSFDRELEELSQTQEGEIKELSVETDSLLEQAIRAYDKGHEDGYEEGYKKGYKKGRNAIDIAYQFAYKLRTRRPQNEILILKKEKENMFKDIDNLEKEKQILLKKNTRIEKQYQDLKNKYDELLANSIKSNLNLLEINRTLENDKAKLICENKKIKKANTGLQKNIRSEQQTVKDIIDGKYTKKPFKYLKMLKYNYDLSFRKLTNNKSKIRRKGNKRNVVL